jgi:hypothetical protein
MTAGIFCCKKMSSKKWQPWLVFVGLALLFWVARYWHSRSFLLYEDDWMIVPQAVAWTTPEVLRYIGEYILQLRGHARPLSDSLIYFFSHLAGKPGGIWGIYLAGFAIQVLNIGLFYSLLRRIAQRVGGSEAFSLIGALGYTLFSADTTQAYLTHSLGLHPSITLLLIAFHLYCPPVGAHSVCPGAGMPMRQGAYHAPLPLQFSRLGAYLLAAVMLFSYETPFLVFLAAPLLEMVWDRPWLKKALRHALIVFGLLAAVFVLRSAVGEGRVGGLGWKELLITPVLHTLQGPWVSLGSHLLRPFQTLASGQPEAYLAALLSFSLFAFLFLRIRTDVPGAASSKHQHRWLKLILAALVMIALAYPLTFTVRAYAISGRDTRVHAAAVVGMGLLWACVGQVLFKWVSTGSTSGGFRQAQPAVVSTGSTGGGFRQAQPAVVSTGSTRARRWGGAFLLAGIFALLFGYGFVIQADYVRAGQLQRTFWAELLPLIADMDVSEGMVVLIEPSGLEDTTQIGANTWILPRLLERLYAFPAIWNRPPRVYRLIPGWQNAIAAENGYLQINGATAIVAWSESFPVPSENVIWINTAGGRLSRQFEPLTVGEQQFPLYGTGSGELEKYPHGIWYDYLLPSPQP